MQLHDLSDDDLLARLTDLCLDARRLDVRIIAFLVEVEERRLHLAAACSSLFEFCVRRLHMSEGAAFRRINAARLTRRFPALVGHLESGSVHLSTLVLLRDHLTEENVDELVAASTHRTKREVQELVACRAPRPDVPSRLRKLPAKGFRNDECVEPLAQARYKMQLTMNAELHEKLERARDLMRHRNPRGELALVMEAAVDALLEKLEKERLGKTTRPHRPMRPITKARISAAARRAVFARDGEQCTFVDAKGRRCESRAFLELDHIEPRALGGRGDPSNLRVVCRAHNLLHAEAVFGRERVERGIHFRRRKSAAGAPQVRAAGG